LGGGGGWIEGSGELKAPAAFSQEKSLLYPLIPRLGGGVSILVSTFRRREKSLTGAETRAMLPICQTVA